MKKLLLVVGLAVVVMLPIVNQDARNAGEDLIAWAKSLSFEDPCSKPDEDSRQACADQQNRIAGKIDSRLDLSDQQRALSKALGN